MSQGKIFNPDRSRSEINNCFFGFPYTLEEAKIVFLPVPWDVTTSYREGTADGPQTILEASPHLDFYDFHVPRAWEIGHGTFPIDEKIRNGSRKMGEIAKKIMAHLDAGGSLEDQIILPLLNTVNQACEELNRWTYEQAISLLEQNKLVGVVGGDHSVPLGFMKALGEKIHNYGILQIDAHCDLRQSFDGFIYSHASIMYNAIKLQSISRLVQVGIRDVCQEEIDLADADPRIIVLNDNQFKANTYKGITYDQQCDIIVENLPEKVYISFDIDGLSPEFCPNTGTPVPGGLDFNQSIYLIQKVVKAGKKIIGFDLCEVAPGNNNLWDGNVGARLLYQLSNLMYLSHQQ